MTEPEQLNKVNLAANDKEVLIGEDLEPHIEAYLVEFLTIILDAFVWQHDNITWISPDIITHKLNVDLNTPPSNRKEGNLE